MLLASQLLVAGIWWKSGTRVGLPLMLASHALAWWGVFRPQSRLYSPVLSRLPMNDDVVWLTIG